MRAYPFEIHAEKETYSFTFLNTVIIRIDYAGKESIENFSVFIKDMFGLDVTDAMYNVKNADALRLVNKDRSVRFKFSSNETEIILNGSGYVNFERSAFPFIERVADYIEGINGKVVRTFIEKVDLWPIMDDNQVDKIGFLKSLFSFQLLSEYGTGAENVRMLEYGDDRLADQLIIKFGFMPGVKDNPEQPPRGVLDIITINEGAIEPRDFRDVANRLNAVQYAAYHWAVTPEVIGIMKGEKL